MAAIRDLIEKNRADLLRRWIGKAIEAYPADAAEFFSREKDRFANPVGQTIAQSLQALFDALIDDMSADRIDLHVDGLMRICAVQDLPPSHAVSFVFALKALLREEIGDKLRDPLIAAELAKTDDLIDQAALIAFDKYAACREEICALRIAELKRSLSSLLEDGKGGSE